MTLESGKFHVLNLFLTLPYQYLNNIFIPKNSEKPVKNSAYSNIHSSDSTIALSYFFWFYRPEKYGDEFPIMVRSLREQFGIARSGRTLELAVKKFPGNDALKLILDPGLV